MASAVAGVVVLGVTAPAALATDACPNAQFRTGPSAELPDCRAYEQVSPREKFGQGVLVNPPTAVTGQNTSGSTMPPDWAAADGDRILANSGLGGGGGSESAVRGLGYPQVISRTADGWSSRMAIDGPPPTTTLDLGRSIPTMQIPSADRTKLVFSAGSVFSSEQPQDGDPTGNGGVFATAADGGVRWLSKPSWAGADLPPGSAGVSSAKFAVVGGSDDLSTVYFMTRQTLTPEDGISGRTWDQRWALYQVKDGVLSNAGTLPEGTVSADGSMSAGLDLPGTDLGGGGTSNLHDTLGSARVVSRDGRRALFVDMGDRTIAGRVPQLYLHRDGQSSLLVSKKPSGLAPVSGSLGVLPIGAISASTMATVSEANSALVLATGDQDLETVLFATQDKLTSTAPDPADDRINTYRYRVASNTLEYLPELDRPFIAAGNGDPSSRSRVGNIYRVSDDGTRIIFRDPDTSELKLWRDGLPTLTLVSGVGPTNKASTGISAARFSDDGKTVVFQSREPIDGNALHPPPVNSTLAQTQVYRFSEDQGNTTPVCVSCPPLNATVRGPATFDLAAVLNNGFGSQLLGKNSVTEARAMNADGRWVFFTTTSTLDPRDKNETADVYGWSADRGSAVLLSSGAPDSRGDGFLDVDASGDNVFFATEEPLTDSDVDEIFDVYVARVGGGLPDPPPVGVDPTCAPGTCQAPPSGAPVVPAPMSQWLAPVTVGGTALLPPEKQRKTLALRVRKGKASSRRITLKVRTPGAGEIRVRGSGLHKTSRTATRSTTYHVHVRLSKHARHTLHRKQRARVRPKVRFTPQKGKAVQKTVKWTIKRASRTSGKGR